MKSRPDETAPAKPLGIELVVLMALCALAGVGAGLAFESELVGLAVAAVGLIAVAAYALAINIERSPRERPEALQQRPEAPRRLSVTDISTRRRRALGQTRAGPEANTSTSTPDIEEGPVVAPVIATTVEADHVIPFRASSGRL